MSVSQRAASLEVPPCGAPSPLPAPRALAGRCPLCAVTVLGRADWIDKDSASSTATANLTVMGETQSGNLDGDIAVADALVALRTPDPRSLSWFIGGAMAPEDAAAYQQRVMARFDVPAPVPETVTKSFDRLRAIYQQALLCYDFYTVAGDQAQLVAELALRERFVEFYGGTVLFTDGQGKPQIVMATTFDGVYWGSAGPTGGRNAGQSSCAAGATGSSSPGAWPASSNGAGGRTAHRAG